MVHPWLASSHLLLGFIMPPRGDIVDTIILHDLLLIALNLGGSTQIWMDIHKIRIVLHFYIFGI